MGEAKDFSHFRHTYVSSHKSCFPKLTFLLQAFPHTKRRRDRLFSLFLFVFLLFWGGEGYLMAVETTFVICTSIMNFEGEK